MKSKGKRNLAKALGLATVLTLTASLGASTFLASANIYNPDADQKFESDYDSPDEVLEAGKELNERIADEGFVLLKNNNNALPLARTERRVSLLGAQANSLYLGGGGSGSQSRPTLGFDDSQVASAAGMQMTESLTSAGFIVNERLADRFASLPLGSTPDGFGQISVDINHYMDVVESDDNYEVEFGGQRFRTAEEGALDGADSSIPLYDDAAILVISRTGSEAVDSPVDSITGHSDPTDHYLELNDSERQLIAYTKLHFDKVIVVINSPSVMELGDLQNDDGIDAFSGWACPAGTARCPSERSSRAKSILRAARSTSI